MKWLALVLAVIPCVVQAQTPKQPSPEDIQMMKVCTDKAEKLGVPPVAPETKGKNADELVPLGLVLCEIENALNAYQQSNDVDDETKKVLPKIASAEIDFKTVSDTKLTGGVGVFIIKLFGGSYDKQKTDELNFTYVPKSLLRTGLEARKAESFQTELINLITNGAKAVREQEGMPTSTDPDPLVFKQLAMTVSFGVTKGISFGVSIPVHIVTLTAELDKSKNNVNSVKLTFAPPPPKEKGKNGTNSD